MPAEMSDYRSCEVFLPRMTVDKICFQRFNIGGQYCLLPIPDDESEEVRKEIEAAWEEIIKIMKTYDLFINFFRQERKLVISKEGKVLKSFYLNEYEDVKRLVDFLNNMRCLTEKIHVDSEDLRIQNMAELLISYQFVLDK